MHDDSAAAAARDAVDLLRRESRLLVSRLRLWTPARFSAGAAPWGTRADLVHHLAQDLADRAIAVEGGLRRALPHLDSDLGLPDQLAVTADDLARSRPSRAVAIEATAHLLAHRAELLGDEVPAGLAVALGVDDVLVRGRKACKRHDMRAFAL